MTGLTARRADPMSLHRHRRSRSSGRRRRLVRSVVAGVGVLVVVAGLVVAAAVGGYPAERPRLLSGAAWLVSSQVGQVTLLDGSSVEVAAQVRVAPAGNRLEVVQQAATAYVVDRTAGSLRRVDGATFEPSAVVTPIADAAGGLLVFAGPHGVYALDSRRGVLTAADPQTLATQGGLVSLASQVDAGAAVVDEHGRLWLLDTATGDLIWLDGDVRRTRRGAVTPGAGLLTLADGAPVLVDTARRSAALLDAGSAATRSSTTLDLRPGERIAVSGAPHATRLYLAAPRGVLAVCELTAANCATVVPLAPDSTDLGTPVETGGRVFVPDYTTGRVWIIDLRESRIVAKPQVLQPRTRFQLLTRDGLVFFNDPDSEHAGVIHLDGGIRTIAKYDPGDPNKRLTDAGSGLGNAPTTKQPPAPEPPKTPTKPPVTTPPPTQPPPPPPDRPAVHIVVSNANPLVGDTVVLQADPDPGKPPPTDARWNFGDGQTATTITTNHQWTTAGTYQVSVQATFPDGQTATTSTTIRVTDRPVVQFTLTVVAPTNGTVTGGGGINCPGTCTATFAAGQAVNLTAQPAGGFAFSGWGDACQGAGGNPNCTVSMTANQTVSASFGPPPTFTLTIASPTNGKVTGPNGIDCPGTCSATFNSGDRPTLTATPVPNDGSIAFTGWGGDCSGGGTCTLTMNGNRNVTASFAVRPILTVDNTAPQAGNITGPGGLDCEPTCTVRYNPGQRITITAVPVNNAFKLQSWDDDCASATGPTCTLTMDSNKKATANWVTCIPSCGSSVGTAAGTTRLSRGSRRPGGPGSAWPDRSATIGRRARLRRARWRAQ
jgi:PKD domain/Divergent InlB B-repeat domain